MPTTATVPTAAATPAAAMPAMTIPAAIPSMATITAAIVVTIPAVECEGYIGLIVVVIIIRAVIGIRPVVIRPIIVVVMTVDNHRMMVMHAVMLARFDMGCG
jgi:hypothetical protein